MILEEEKISIKNLYKEDPELELSFKIGEYADDESYKTEYKFSKQVQNEQKTGKIAYWFRQTWKSYY